MIILHKHNILFLTDQPFLIKINLLETSFDILVHLLVSLFNLHYDDLFFYLAVFYRAVEGNVAVVCCFVVEDEKLLVDLVGYYLGIFLQVDLLGLFVVDLENEFEAVYLAERFLVLR